MPFSYGVSVKTGHWLYNGEVPTGVRIVESDTAHGTGDYEDPPDIRDDKAVKCFYVEWCAAGTDSGCSARVGPYQTLTEAEASVMELSRKTVVWQE